MNARTLWLKVHLYLGLFAGAVLALLGITGSALVFGEQIDRFLDPQIDVQIAPEVTPEGVMETVERQYGRRPYYIEVAGGGAYKAFIEEGATDSAGVRAIFVDPRHDSVLASARWGGYFSSFMRELHEGLFLEDAGHYLVGVVGILTLVSIVTGLYLWWPRAGRWRAALLMRWSRQPLTMNFEIHRISGFYLAAGLLAISLSGTYLVFPQAFANVIGVFSPTTHWPETVQSRPATAGARALPLAEVRRVLETHRPGARVTGYQMPATATEAYAVYYRDIAEPYSRFGLSTMWIDQYSGEVLLANDYARASLADRLISAQYLLHNGELLGLAGQWLVFFTGLLIPVMYGTGLYLWWRRRRRSRPG